MLFHPAAAGDTYHAVIAGAGFAGAVTARILAENGLHVLVLEKRPHIGGNAYDCPNPESGLRIHCYGPHIFHTNNRAVFDFLSRFTDWNGYEHKVLANVYGKFLPVPFNLEALRLVYGADRAAMLSKTLSQSYGEGQNVSILELMKTDNPQLQALGKYIYDNIFETYTVKQWDLPPERIDPATTARVPIRLSDDCRYFTDRYQGLPSDGYTALFERLLRHENITLATGTDALREMKVDTQRKTLVFRGKPFEGVFVYTGEADVLLGGRFGSLPYRTLDFVFETHDCEFFQPCGTVNYTVDMPYTRITEFKHMTGESAKKTVILKEFSKAYVPHSGQIPYYPIANAESAAIYRQYADALAGVKGLYLAGRLAEYKYYNMDAAAARAMSIAEDILAVL